MRKQLNLEFIIVPDDTQYAAYHDAGNEMPSLLGESFLIFICLRRLQYRCVSIKFPKLFSILMASLGLGGVPKRHTGFTKIHNVERTSSYENKSFGLVRDRVYVFFELLY